MKSKSEGLAACLAHGKHPIHIIINFIAKWLISLLVLHFPEALFCILTKLHFHHFPYSCKACFLNQMLPFLWPLYPWPFPLSFFHLSWIWTGSHNTSHFILKEPSEQSFYSCLADHSLHALQNLLLPSLCTLQSLYPSLSADDHMLWFIFKTHDHMSWPPSVFLYVSSSDFPFSPAAWVLWSCVPSNLRHISVLSLANCSDGFISPLPLWFSHFCSLNYLLAFLSICFLLCTNFSACQKFQPSSSLKIQLQHHSQSPWLFLICVTL